MSFRYHFGRLIRTWLQNVKSGYERTIVKAFSTQVMSYHFGHFVPLLFLFCTHLYLTDGWINR